jgi:small-conductance mechanosensitive channel
MLGLVLAALAFAGCGSASSTSSAGSTPTKAEFIAKGDALCEAAKAKLDPLRATLGKIVQKASAESRDSGTLSDRTRGELARALEQAADINDADLSRFQGLQAPSEDSSQLKAIIQGTESALAESHAYAAALEGHEDAKAQAAAEKYGTEAREIASLEKQYGFKVCGTQGY